MPNLQNIKLIGTGIGENLGELAGSFKNANIKSIELPYNGIMKNYLTTYFKYMFNFENLIELNLSSNWFGTDGLFEMKDEFIRFQKLKILKLGTNKLCFGAPGEEINAKKFAEILLSFKDIEELDIQENSINDFKFDFVIPSLVKFHNLKSLNL